MQVIRLQVNELEQRQNFEKPKFNFCIKHFGN